MKRVLFDHCVPRPFRDLLIDCNVSTAVEMGWERLTNGELLAAAQAAGFDVLVTADKSLQYQQNLQSRQIAIIELPTNRLRLMANNAPQANAALATISPGEYVVIAF
jgi:hypothetical protein